MKLYLLCAAMLFSAAFSNSFAQSKDEIKYRTQSEAIRKEVWGWDKPQFKIKEVPAIYAGASKVVLAQHTELTADSKSKFQFYGMGFGVKHEQTITETAREMVKLNDKTAVEEYSELSFTKFEKASGFYSTDKTTSYVGVRVIKPNGTVKEINADDVILTKDEASEKKAKVAIPDLQPGDILDYFICTEQSMANDYSSKPYHVILFNDAPVLSHSFHAQLGKKYSIEYRSYNDAPELKVAKNDDKEIIVDVEKTNTPAFETALWVSPGLQLPYIRMNISMLSSGKINKISTGEAAVNTKISSLSGTYYGNYWLKANRKQYYELFDDAVKYAKRSGTKWDDMSEAEKAALMYYTFRFTKVINFDINSLTDKINVTDSRYDGLSFLLYALLKAGYREGTIVLSGSRDDVRIGDAFTSDDVHTVTYLESLNKYFTMESVFDMPFTTPAALEGMPGTQQVSFYDKMAKVGEKVTDGPTLPITSSTDNAHIENLRLSVVPDKSLVAVKRSTTLKGHYKADEQHNLIVYEDLYESERKAFNEEKSLLDDLDDGRKSKKYADEVRNAFAEDRKKQKEAFTKEAKEEFDQEVTDIKNIKTDTLGIRHTAPNFVYSSEFNLGGMVKKAGNNMILEIGKIEGSPLSVKADQRKRTLDIYMPFARSLEHNIQIEIPEGYTAEGIAALNKKVENETGYFSAEASATDKIITIKIKKHYLHNYEPAANWDKMLVFLDAANDWLNSKILLKKK